MFRLAKKFKEDEYMSPKQNIQDRTHSKKRTVDSGLFLTLLEAKIKDNPSMSIGDLPKFFNVLYPTMLTAMHEDFRYKSHKR